MKEWIIWKVNCIWYRIKLPVLYVFDFIKAMFFGMFVMLTPFAFILVPILLAELGYIPAWTALIPIVILILFGCWVVGSLVVVARR